MTAPTTEPFVLGGTLHRRPSRAGIVSTAAICLVIAIPLRGLYLGTGSSMEEGFMLVFPNRMLAGAVPNVDFLHLYGPTALHVLAGWYTLFGYTLGAERTFGLLQHLGIIFALYSIARVWGHRVATVAAIAVMLLVLTPIGLSALAWEGAVALALWSLVLALRARATTGGPQRRAAASSGLLAGLAVGYRPDLVIALGLALVFVSWRSPWWRRLLIGLGIGIIPIIVHLAMAGPDAALRGMVLDPVFKLRPGRQLPRPPSWGKIDGALQAVVEGPADAPWWKLPALSANHQLFIWFWSVVVIAIALPIVTWRRWRVERTAALTVMLTVSILGLGMLPQALQRPDSTHLAWGSCVSFALLPCAVAVFGGGRLSRRTSWMAAGVLTAAALLVVCPFYTYRTYLLATRISAGNKQGGFEVSRDGRRFYFGNQPLQSASQAAIDELDRQFTPGQRLLVGPADLSRTIYSDVVFYYLFPELKPATYFIEMDPGLADEEGSRLAGDVASANWLILTNFWTGWYEPNASSTFGSQAPNAVVAKDFCLVGNYEDALVLLYRRCAVGDGISPAGIGIGADRRASLDAELAKHGQP